MGIGSTTSSSSPVQIGTATDWVLAAAGFGHSMAAKSTQDLWAWGGNSAGQVGNGTTTNQTSPVQLSLNVVVLPVELVSFTGYHKGGVNVLNWATANEVNNKGFNVERLMDNGQWAMLGFVKAKGKAATYDFIDNQPLSVSYYRLRQMDNDGKETLSKVISVERKGNNKLKAYPNPVSNILTIETTEQGDFQILNLLGQSVLSGKTAQRIDVSALPQGTYILKVGAEQAKFLKQ